jgi:spore maturation protein CgeB
MNGNLTFRKNISALRIHDPELASMIMSEVETSSIEVTEAGSGALTIRVNGRLLHSAYDPEAEAAAWAEHSLKEVRKAERVYILGFGLGYHIKALMRRVKGRIVVVEPNIGILAAAFRNVDLSMLLGGMEIVTGISSRIDGSRMCVLEHVPSVNLDPAFFRKAKMRLTAYARINRGLKILVVSPIYGGSLPIAGYCSAALRRIGHNSELLDFGRFSDALFFAREISDKGGRYSNMIERLSDFLSEAVLARCTESRPDLVLALAQAPLAPWCVKEIRSLGISTAFWFVEDFRMMEYWRNTAPLYDHFFTIQRGEFFEELQSAGVRNFAYLPPAADPAMHRPLKLSVDERGYYGSDVSFVGAGYYNRRHFFKGLVDMDFKIWGSDWDNEPALAQFIQRDGRRITPEETVSIFNASRININLHSSTYHKGVNPFGDFVNPRTFEIASCGAFQIVDRRAELPALFREDEEIVCFDSIEELRDKIHYYLDNPDERMSIAARSRMRVLRDHTYETRMRQMLETMADQGFLPAEHVSDGMDVDALIREAGADTELGRFLSRFAGREDLSFEEITGSIQEGEGELSDTEKIIMIMREAVR